MSPKKRRSKQEKGGGEASRGQSAQSDESPSLKPAPTTATNKRPPVMLYTRDYPIRNFGEGTGDNIEHYRQELLQNLNDLQRAADRNTDRVQKLYEKRYVLEKSVAKRSKGRKGMKKENNELKEVVTNINNGAKIHDRRREVTTLYEDFMYYQNPRHRRDFIADKDSTNQARKYAHLLGKIPPVRLSDERLYKHLAPNVRGMRRFNVGNASRLKKKATHEELHMRTPNSRRERTGFGRPSRPPRLKPLDFEMDDEQIEQKRMEVDNRVDDVTKGLEYRTHEERRVAQSTHPCPNIPLETLERLTTKGGMFVAARERSDDWPTSFDYLNVARCGAIAREPTEEEMRDARDGRGTREDGDVMSTREEMDAGENKSATGHKSSTGDNSVVGDRSDDKSDYSDHEFAKYPRQPRTDWKYQEATPWAEATIGRREWHAYLMLSPSSTVCSLPRTPNEELDSESMPLELHTRILTSNECETYHNRVQDHYGLLDENWPRIGMRVPYHPDSYSHIEEQSPSSGARGQKIIKSMHPSLQPAVDLESGTFFNSGTSPEPHFEDKESDDEGDAFMASYRECSRFSTTRQREVNVAAV